VVEGVTAKRGSPPAPAECAGPRAGAGGEPQAHGYEAASVITLLAVVPSPCWNVPRRAGGRHSASGLVLRECGNWFYASVAMFAVVFLYVNLRR
jgi:hypothetical protein